MNSAKSVQSQLLIVVLISTSLWKQSHGVGLHKQDNDFCYADPDCGPESDHWAPLCHDGARQSPISLPSRVKRLPGAYSLQLNSYRSESFRMQNNGHTAVIEFQDSARTNLFSGDSISTLFPFPDPVRLHKYAPDETNFYKFDSAHFHWGPKDGFGSEHCFDHHCFSMELHLVHYLSTYDDMSEALESGEPNALAVIAVLFYVSPEVGKGNPALAPIVNNLFKIEESSHDDWTNVNHPLDFTPLLYTGQRPTLTYTYKGSLTTPDCNEQVSWFVFKKPIPISRRDVNAFRFLRDNRGDLLTENFRPIQEKKGRSIFLAPVKPL